MERMYIFKEFYLGLFSCLFLKFISVFLAALGLCCCMPVFSSWGVRAFRCSDLGHTGHPDTVWEGPPRGCEYLEQESLGPS